MRQFDDDRMLSLIGLIYDAALDERLWAGVAGSIASAFEASSMSLRLRSSRTGKGPLLACTENMLALNTQEYTSHYWRHDKWVNRSTELGNSRILISKELVSDEELERSEWYRDWARKAEIFYIAGVVFPAGDGDMIALGVHRARREGDFEKQDKRPVLQFLPHLKRALQLRRRLFANDVERGATLDALDRTGIATFIVAQDGLMLYANRQGESMMKHGDGICVTRDRLRTSDEHADKALALAIKTSVRIATGDLPAAPPRAFVIRRTNRLPITVLVSPFKPARDGFGLPVPAAIVLARDPEWPTASQAALQSMFGLTAAEASIAREMAVGRSVNDIAARHRITLNTIRTHIRNIFGKTGTNRQPELVALLSVTVAFLHGDSEEEKEAIGQ